ncbi:MAG: hypothetical protein NUV56_02125 [Candidatus Uhrbacteria bacterium]|nr:hypothetical protein [Candidatus Uhrbacteria bacterium]
MSNQSRKLTSFSDAARAGDAAIANYRGQISDLRQEKSGIFDSMNEIKQKIETFINDIALRVLAEVDREAVLIVSTEFGALRITTTFDSVTRQISEQERICIACEGDWRFAGAEALIADDQGYIDSLTAELNPLQNEYARFGRSQDFHEVYRSTLPVPQPSSGSIAWRWFTKYALFGFIWQPIQEKARLIEKCEREERVKDEFENSLIEAIVARYRELPDKIRRLESILDVKRVAIRQVQELVSGHANAVKKKADLRLGLPDQVRMAFVDYLTVCTEWREIRQQARPELRLTISTIMALREKHHSLEQMSAYLGKEVIDREKRLNGINDTVRKWRQRPSNRLRKDPSEWLCTIPAKKAQATSAIVPRVHTMHETVYVYDRYGAYDGFLNTHTNLLLWDMIAHDHHGHLPHSGFVHAVMPDVAAHHGQHPESQEAMGAAYTEAGIEPLEHGDPGEFTNDTDFSSMENDPTFDQSFDDGSSTGYESGGYSGGDSGGGYDGGGDSGGDGGGGGGD